MSSGVTSTLAAVQAGDLSTAQQEFTKLQESWTGLEGTVKTKSVKAYEEINGHMTTLGTLFKSGKPDANAAQLTSELQALGKSLTTVLTQK
jgi:iron uptake system EfeUOB component EfeO/EfeM